MKVLKFTYCFVAAFIILEFSAFSQDTTLSSPIKQGEILKKMKIGIFGGLSYPAAPAELKNSPVNSTSTVQQSLLNGFDGLGYGITFNAGLLFRYPITQKLSLGANFSMLSSWKSDIKCNCIDSLVGISNNSLSILQFSIIPQYFVYDKFYVAPEISLNMFKVHTTESDPKRDTVDFSKTYSRIGLGLAIGYEYAISKSFLLDLSIKSQFPNLLLKKADDPKTPESESIINPTNDNNESTFILLSFSLGVLFAF